MLLPRKPSAPDASSNHSQTTLLHITAYGTTVSGSRRRWRSSTAKAGSSQTRWWTQVMGLTRHAVSPVRANAAARSPARTAARARHAHTPSTVRTISAQTAWLRPDGTGRLVRCREPGQDTCSDWLETSSRRPMRLVSHSASVQ
ncbi:hypothetical protein SGFS_012260 [Streptomyces graminofaciens]|uniref:Uncharacterized protein n=1 Tax=Streptomyces graminofaciens TaxID=68212 RepID=A0ABN5V9K9_9ACTN|nr:hypothetical protein [Streptomyces graminofaciens]BBC29932.1 hypothetical protein SGFS_012260 [Streptomyces graminofaciens]